jgi:hypothetical protein
MKTKILLLTTFLFFGKIVLCQTTMSLSKPLKSFKTSTPEVDPLKLSLLIKGVPINGTSREKNKNSFDSLLIDSSLLTLDFQQQKIFDSYFSDYMTDGNLSESDMDSINQADYINRLNQTDPIKLLAVGGISNLEELSTSFGNLSVGLLFRLSKYKKYRNTNFIDPHFLYFLFNTKTATSPDSNSVQKSLLFPELAKRDFVLGYYWELQKNDWYIAPSFEFSLNKYLDSSSKKVFVTQNILIGSRISKRYTVTSKDIDVGFEIFPSFNITHTDSKYNIEYRNLLGEPKMPNTLYVAGLKAAVQVKNLNLFCNMKYVLGDKVNELTSTELKRFVYTIGTAITLF